MFWQSPIRRRLARLIVASVIFAAPALSAFASVQAAAPGPSLELRAPNHASVGDPVLITLTVNNAADVAGFESDLLFDTRVADFDGLRQRRNDLKAQGRDVMSLGPVPRPDGVSFGLLTCPTANCLDRGSTRHSRGGSGRLQLATVALIPRQPGTLELRLADATFVDADGTPVAVSGTDAVTRIEVDSPQPVFAAPVAGPTPPRSASAAAAGPFDLSHDGVVDQRDAALVALAWTNLREAGAVCGPEVDPALDVNHDGCLDVSDVQAVAAQQTPPGVAAAAAVSDVASDAEGLSAAAVGAAAPLAAPLSLVVNSTADDDDATIGDGICRTAAGACTLPAAIEEANAHVGPDSISFAIPGTGVQTIVAPNGLPTLTDDGTTIDGYTQSGAIPNSSATLDNAVIKIEVRGNLNATTGQPANTAQGVSVASSNNTIRGLAVYNYQDSVALFNIGAQQNRIVGNFLGTNAAATVQPPAQPGGFGSLGAGVILFGGAQHNQVGDTSAADRNLLSGNFGSGVSFFDEDTDYNTIYNNLIGLNPQGTNRVLNTKHGVDVNSLSSFNVIGGTDPGQRNVIDGNLEDGVELSHDTLTVENQVVGNYIGTDVTGNASVAALANLGWGVHIHDGPTNNTISSNVIGNSAEGGINIHDFNNWGNHIVNNRIGIGVNGGSIPNQQFGVQVGFHGDRVTIGPGNIIANNPEGVSIPNQTNVGVTVTRNSIFNNRSQQSCGLAGRGIDVAPIDPCDPNNSQSPSPGNNGILGPVLNTATVSAVSATTCASCTVEVFLADSGAAAAGSVTPSGQGKTFVGAGAADATGHATVPISGVSLGAVLTATATDSLGDTSEFSTNVSVGSGTLTPPTPTPVPSGPPPLALDTFTRQVTNGWANADVGGVWATEAENHVAGQAFTGYNVNGSAGTMLNDTSAVFRSAFLTDVSAHDEDVSFRVQSDKAASPGGFLFVYAAARRSDSGNGTQYLGRVVLGASGGVSIQAAKTLPCGASNSTCAPFVLVGSEVGVSGSTATHVAGRYLRVHLQVQGANPTTIRLNVWNDGQAEPAGWELTQTDSEPILQTNPGSVGVRSLAVNGTTSNLPVTFTYDDFRATNLNPGAPAPTPTPTATPTTPAPTSTPTLAATATPTPTTGAVTTLAADNFARTLSGSWGSATTGGAYTVCCTAANFSVASNSGRIANPSTNLSQSATLLGVSARDVNMAVKITPSKVPTGGNMYAYLILRRVNNSTYYMARVRFGSNGQVFLQVFQRTAGGDIALGSEVLVPGFTLTANAPLMVRAEAFGASPILRMRAWVPGQAEPTTWQYTFTDTSASAIQQAGALGILSYVSTAVTNVPITYSFGTLSATNAP